MTGAGGFAGDPVSTSLTATATDPASTPSTTGPTTATPTHTHPTTAGTPTTTPSETSGSTVAPTSAPYTAPTHPTSSSSRSSHPPPPPPPPPPPSTLTLTINVTGPAGLALSFEKPAGRALCTSRHCRGTFPNPTDIVLRPVYPLDSNTYQVKWDPKCYDLGQNENPGCKMHLDADQDISVTFTLVT